MRLKKQLIIFFLVSLCVTIGFIILKQRYEPSEDDIDMPERINGVEKATENPQIKIPGDTERINADREELANELEDNYQAFEKIAKFIIQTEDFHVYKISKTALKDISGNLIDVDSLEIGGELKLIIFELNYCEIMDYGDKVKFTKDAGIFENGMIFLKDGSVPENSTFAPNILIKDNWYYYERYHT